MIILPHWERMAYYEGLTRPRTGFRDKYFVTKNFPTFKVPGGLYKVMKV